MILVCWDHFQEDISSCEDHGQTPKPNKQGENVIAISDTGISVSNEGVTNDGPDITPESFEVEGSARQATQKKERE